MIDQIELFSIGFAAVIQTVLLLVVLERVNRPLTAISLKWALTGATLWYVATFFHVLLRQTEGRTASWLDVLCMTTMCGGLLLLSCGILHAGLRLQQTGVTPRPDRDRRYFTIYVPVLFLLAIGAGIARSGSRDFLAATQHYQISYVLWMTMANLTAAWMFFRNRDRVSEDDNVKRFLMRFSVSLVIVTITVCVYLGVSVEETTERWLGLTTSLSPLIPTLIFAWYVFRRRLLPMVFERTLAYGAILLAVFYLHRLTLSPLMEKINDQTQFDFVVVEGILLVALVLAYDPLRHRVREGLRYLVSGSVSEVRDATRTVSIALTQNANEQPDEISRRFVRDLQQALRLNFTWLRLTSPFELNCHFEEEDFVPSEQLGSIDLHGMDSDQWVDRSRCADPGLSNMLRDFDLIAVFPVDHHHVRGHLFLGLPRSADRLTDEQLNAVKLLVDQFAATVHNRQLETARQSAERHAVQQEQLSMLGLLSGSLAHEIRNPLSSIRTIVTLLKEDFPRDSDQAGEVDLIVSEIDRLTETTQGLLDFARPKSAGQGGVCPDVVIERLMKILSHFAGQHGVEVTCDLSLDGTTAAVPATSLNDVLFNLIKNAIEAVRSTDDRRVQISTSCDSGQRLLIEVSDSGPGISPDLQDQIFEPFVTGKTDGTGLGLYLVGQRIQEMDSEIKCSSSNQGTTFKVWLPQEIRP